MARKGIRDTAENDLFPIGTETSDFMAGAELLSSLASQLKTPTAKPSMRPARLDAVLSPSDPAIYCPPHILAEADKWKI